jgi:xanthine dehydrogenase accessory factor
MKAELKETGLESALVETLHSPIGLELGGNTPNEIAISVAAQLLSYRSPRH